MIRIFHTADWQIGLKASHVARVGDVVRKARFEAARAIVAQANADRSDALILAGDIFEDNHVDNALVRETVQILSASAVPVFVLPGNHDPLSQDSVYKRASWLERPAHVRLLDTTEPVSIAGGQALLLPAPLSLKKSDVDPTLALRLPTGGAGGVLIGVAHGSLKIEGKHGRDDFPIALDVAARSGLQYLALGHWHGRYLHGDRVAYSGTLETTKFGEDNSGFALRVSFDETGRQAPVIEDFGSGRLTWLSHELRLMPGSDLPIQELRRALEAYAGARDRTLVRVRTHGESDADGDLRIKELEAELSSRYLYFDLVRNDLPSHVVQGRVAELAAKNPFVAGLFEDLKLLPEVERMSARSLLTELLLDGKAGQA